MNDFLNFNYKGALGIINIRLRKYEQDLEKIKMLSLWLGKGTVTTLLLFLLQRINKSFNSESNGWQYQDINLVAQVNKEMETLLANKWTGVEKPLEVTPIINE